MEQENKPTDKEAIDFLIKQGYTKTVTYPDKTTVEPTFQWETVIRLLDEYAASLIKERDELKERCIDWAKASDEKDRAVNQLNHLVSQRSNQLMQLQSSNEAKEKELIELRAEIGDDNEIIEEYKKEIERLEEQVTLLKLTVEQLRPFTKDNSPF